MANEKLSQYDPAGELTPKDLLDISVFPIAPDSSKKATHFQVTGGEKISKVFGDFSDASTQKTIVVFTLKGGRKNMEFVLKHEDSWGGGSVSAVTVELGIAGDEGKYTFDPFDIFQAPGDTPDEFLHEEPNTIEDMVSDVDIVMRITSTGDDLDQLNAGSIDLFIFTKSMKP